MESAFDLAIDSSPTSKFPSNHGSHFSCPLELNLTNGDWQVAVTDFTHSKDLLTSAGESIIHVYSSQCETKILSSKTPIQINLKSMPTLHHVLTFIQQNFKTLLQVTWDKTKCTWKVLNSNYYVVLSKALRQAVHLWHDVLTSWDKSPTNCLPVDYEQALPPNQYLIFVPASYQHETYVIKSQHEAYTCDVLLQSLNNSMPSSYEKGVLRISTNNKLCILSEALHDILPFHQAGAYSHSLKRQWDGNCSMNIKKKYLIYTYALTNITVIEDIFPIQSSAQIALTKGYKRPTSEAENLVLMDVLNNVLKDIDVNFSLRYDNHVVIDMKSFKNKIVMSEEFMNILGFDENVLLAPNIYVSQRPLSIDCNQLNVYCSLVNHSVVNGADKQLLLSIPFNSNVSAMKPMYVPLTALKAKQIDIVIRNEKGNLVPFSSEVKTRLQLHFRK